MANGNGVRQVVNLLFNLYINELCLSLNYCINVGCCFSSRYMLMTWYI